MLGFSVSIVQFQLCGSTRRSRVPTSIRGVAMRNIICNALCFSFLFLANSALAQVTLNENLYCDQVKLCPPDARGDDCRLEQAAANRACRAARKTIKAQSGKKTPPSTKSAASPDTSTSVSTGTSVTVAEPCSIGRSSGGIKSCDEGPESPQATFDPTDGGLDEPPPATARSQNLPVASSQYQYGRPQTSARGSGQCQQVLNALTGRSASYGLAIGGYVEGRAEQLASWYRANCQ
jgi:hypothetical protein